MSENRRPHLGIFLTHTVHKSSDAFTGGNNSVLW